jgi:hypothetical protein
MIKRSKKQTQHANDLKIAKLRTLRGPSKRDPVARGNSFVILTHDADAADKCLKRGIFLNCRLFNTEKYTPQYQLTQCYKCQRYGHKAGHCRGKENLGDVETIMLPKTAKPTYTNAPTAEMTTRHGTPTAHGGEGE